MSNNIILRSIEAVANILKLNNECSMLEIDDNTRKSIIEIFGTDKIKDIKMIKDESYKVLKDIYETGLIDHEIKSKICNSFELGDKANLLSYMECMIIIDMKYLNSIYTNISYSFINILEVISKNRSYINEIESLEDVLVELKLLSHEEIEFGNLLQEIAEIPSSFAKYIEEYDFLQINNPICYAIKKAISYATMDDKKKKFIKFNKVLNEISSEIEVDLSVSTKELFDVVIEDIMAKEYSKKEVIITENKKGQDSKGSDEIKGKVVQQLPKRGGTFDAIGANFKVEEGKSVIYDKKNIKILGKVKVDGELSFINSIVEIEEQINLTGKLNFENCEIIFRGLPDVEIKNGIIYATNRINKTHFIKSEFVFDEVCDEVELNIINCDIRHEGDSERENAYLEIINLKRCSNINITKSTFTNTKRLISVEDNSDIEISMCKFILHEGFIVNGTDLRRIKLTNLLIENSNSSTYNQDYILSSYTSPLITVDSKDAYMENIKFESIEGYLLYISSDHFVMKNCKFINCSIESNEKFNFRSGVINISGKKIIENCEFINIPNGPVIQGEGIIRNTLFKDIIYEYAINSQGETNEETKFNNCRFENCFGGIYFDNYSNGVVHNCEFKNAKIDKSSYAITVRTCNNNKVVKITNCKFVDCGDHDEALEYECMYSSGMFGKKVSFDAITIKNCSFE